MQIQKSRAVAGLVGVAVAAALACSATSPDGGGATKTTQPVEAQPVEAKPVEAKPVEAKLDPEVKPVEPKPEPRPEMPMPAT